MVRVKNPLALVLHVERGGTKAQGIIVAATSFHCGSVENEKDTTVILCAGLLPGRSAIPEAQPMRSALPPLCSIVAKDDMRFEATARHRRQR